MDDKEKLNETEDLDHESYDSPEPQVLSKEEMAKIEKETIQ